MDTYKVSGVYGFQLKNNEFLKLLLSKLEDKPGWAGEVIMTTPTASDMLEVDEDNFGLLAHAMYESQWTHKGILYGFPDLPDFFELGTNRGQQKARELFPNLPVGVKLFQMYTEELMSIWFLGVEIQCWVLKPGEKPPTTVDTNKLQPEDEKIKDLVAQYGSFMDGKVKAFIVSNANGPC